MQYAFSVYLLKLRISDKSTLCGAHCRMSSLLLHQMLNLENYAKQRAVRNFKIHAEF